MSEVKSLTLRRGLLERLKDPICCSESKDVCRDDKFCSSKPQDWLEFVNGTANGTPMVLLSYPEDDEKPSIRGPASLCSGYMSWYTKSGCGALTREIANGISGAGQCVISRDPRAFIDKILGGAPRRQRAELERMLRAEIEKLSEPYNQWCTDVTARLGSLQAEMVSRCGIMYDKNASGDSVFNAGRAEDLHKIANFCQDVQEAEQKRFNWNAFSKGGGAAGIIGAILVAAFKAIRWMRRTKEKIVEIKEKGNDAEFALTEGSNLLNRLARASNQFFGVAVRNFGRAMRYLVTLGPLRGKSPPSEITAGPPPSKETEAAEAQSRTTQAGTAADDEAQVIKPALNVVFAQLTALKESEHYASEGKFFASLDNVTQRYLAYLAIKEWNELPEEKQTFYISDDNRLTEGKLPVGFVIRFAHTYLDEKMREIITPSANAWLKREVSAQILVVFSEFGTHPPWLMEARTKLILRTWGKLPEAIQTELWRLDNSVEIQEGPYGLPWSFIDIMRPALTVGKTQRDPVQRSLQAWTYEQAKPPMDSGFDPREIMRTIVRIDEGIAYYQSILEDRALFILRGWLGLDGAIKELIVKAADAEAAQSEGRTPGSNGIPDFYVNLLYGVHAGIGTEGRDPLEVLETTLAPQKTAADATDDAGEGPKNGKKKPPPSTPNGPAGGGLSASGGSQGIGGIETVSPPMDVSAYFMQGDPATYAGDSIDPVDSAATVVFGGAASVAQPPAAIPMIGTGGAIFMSSGVAP